MNKKIQPKVHEVTYKCASCGAEYKIRSTLNVDTMSIDVCSNCHPFYIGKTQNQKVKGRAEKLSAKFAAGKKTLESKPVKVEKKARSKKKQVTLDDLK